MGTHAAANDNAIISTAEIEAALAGVIFIDHQASTGGLSAIERVLAESAVNAMSEAEIDRALSENWGA